MIDAAIVGLGRWGRSFVESVQGKSSRIRFVRGVETNPDPAPLDTASAMYEFENGASGLLATLRATPFYWRIHAFGTLGSAEVLGETELVRHRSGTRPEHIHLPAADSLVSELEAFADAIDGRAPFPVTPAQMLATVAAFEATVRALETGLAVEVEAGSMRCTHGT